MEKTPKLPRDYLLPPVFFFLASLVFTWPLVTRLQGWVPGFGDWGQNMWALWWTRKALLALGQTPFFTNYLFFPDGVTLLFHPVDVADGLLILPIYGLVGGDVAYNLIVLVSFFLSGLGTYYLVLYLTRNRWAALVAGLAFAFSPYHFLRLELGHLNLSSMQWIPFYILFLLKYIRQGRQRFGWLAVLFIVLNALCSWYYVVACGILSLMTLGWCLLRPISLWRLAMRVALVLGVSIIILSPLLVPMFRLLDTTNIIGEHDPARHSVDVHSFLVPGPPSTWAEPFKKVWAPFAAQNREPGSSAYLGYGIAVLALVSLVVGRRRLEAAWWLAAGLMFVVLSLGPHLQLGGQELDITLPYAYLYTYVPGFSTTGLPGRFVVMISLIAAVMAGYGLAALMRRFPSRLAVLSPVPMVPLVAVIWVSAEFLALPVAGSDTRLADFYYQLAEDRESYAILDFKWDANFLMYAQTIHDKPLVGGWLARLPEDQAEYLNQGSVDKSVTYLLLGEEGFAISDPTARRQALNRSLADHQVKYIIDHDDVLGGWIRGELGWTPIHSENVVEDVVVYSATP